MARADNTASRGGPSSLHGDIRAPAEQLYTRARSRKTFCVSRRQTRCATSPTPCAAPAGFSAATRFRTDSGERKGDCL